MKQNRHLSLTYFCLSFYLFYRLFGANGACSSCGQSIPANELVMRSQSKVYHLKCFSCSSCHIQLVPGDRYTFVNGSLVCENDHSKMYKTHGPLSNVGLRPGNKVWYTVFFFFLFFFILSHCLIKEPPQR